VTVRDDKLVRRIMERFTQLAYRRAFNAMPDRFGFLKQELVIQIASRNLGRLYLDSYFAVYVNDGSNLKSREGDASVPPYIWYKNPKLDPRLNNGKTPPRWANYPISKLTAQKLRADFAAGKVIITRKSAIRKGSHFFDNDKGMKGFREEAGREAAKMFSDHVKAELGADFRAREVIG